jgi:hypothetical protein
LYYCHSREDGNPEKWENSTFYEIVNIDGFVKSLKASFGVILARAGVQQVGWVEERNPKKD